MIPVKNLLLACHENLHEIFLFSDPTHKVATLFTECAHYVQFCLLFLYFQCFFADLLGYWIQIGLDDLTEELIEKLFVSYHSVLYYLFCIIAAAEKRREEASKEREQSKDYESEPDEEPGKEYTTGDTTEEVGETKASSTKGTDALKRKQSSDSLFQKESGHTGLDDSATKSLKTGKVSHKLQDPYRRKETSEPSEKNKGAKEDGTKQSPSQTTKKSSDPKNDSYKQQKGSKKKDSKS